MSSEYSELAKSLRGIASGSVMLRVSNGVTVSRSMLVKAAEAIEALRSNPPSGAGVAIKPLEWEDADEGMCTKWRAEALGGHYELVNFGKDDPGFAVNFSWGRPLSYWFIQGEPNEWGPTGPKIFPTLDEAKAAAQADYERRILSSLSHKPDAAETNASAEARLREALRQRDIDIGILLANLRFLEDTLGESLEDEDGDMVRRIEQELVARRALSAPHTSDCYKQGCMGDNSPGDAKDLQELLAKPSVLEPSDRTADVTVDELHAFILKHGDEWEDEGVAARALLDAFTIGRR